MKTTFLNKMIRTYTLYFKFLFSVILIGIICYLTLWYRPDEDVAKYSFKYMDKLIHFIMFGALSFVFSLDFQAHFRQSNLTPLAIWFISSLISTIFGGGIEFLQAYCFELRTGDFYDWLADLLGAFLFSFIYMKYCYQKLAQFL